jgi:hypothetical protein
VEGLLAASIALEDAPDLDLFIDEDEFEADLIAEDNSEILELSALNWITIAEEMANTGFRGAYNLIPKSADFFSVCLRAPDRQA